MKKSAGAADFYKPLAALLPCDITLILSFSFIIWLHIVASFCDILEFFQGSLPLPFRMENFWDLCSSKSSRRFNNNW
jgi:hypothetical protein